ncbi:LacI family DNA-binding transcriptional regulator [Microbacterium sp. WCS2018Hpa-23]|uniref:LacI family DNA-binding transcriptional regulator n=1 Tax=Microbacterium sp. WCS2018Hpa-23 TaxID=3073634 RepID=UPI002882D794|nr:LacI family DNA-binding transcriptional regulator [Microbacterium sp. WCS2018Hpa-23]
MARLAQRTPTMDDVAELAGVSRTTVSRVFSNTVTVDPLLSQKVHDAAAKLRYSPSQIARGLAKGRTHSVGILVPELDNPIFQRTLTGLSQAAGEDRYQVLIADSSERLANEAELITELRRRCDAIVLCSPRMDDAELSTLVARLGPVVMIYRSVPVPGVPVIAVSLEDGVRLLAEHLHELGHRHIAFLDGGEKSRSGARRFAALEEFCADHPDVRVSRVTGGGTIQAGYAAADAVLATDATAVMAFNDVVAMGLLSALQRRGVVVPEQLSVTGFDDITFSEFTNPPLTTAAIPAEELGRLAWERLHAMLVDGETDDGATVVPSVHLRASTSAVISD